MDLFTIICTTCKSRLKVRDPAAVGQILACPKCGGMVMVKPPPAYVDAGDQKSDLPTATEVEGPALRLDQTFDSAAFDAVEELLSDAPPKVPLTKKSAAMSLPEKFKRLLELQKIAYEIRIAREDQLQSWEKPWDVEP